MRRRRLRKKMENNSPMNYMFFKKIIFFFSVLCFLTGCISNKKHLLALENQAKRGAAILEQETSLRDSKIRRAEESITNLNLQLAEAKGENNILIMLRGELEDRITQLEGTIENVSSKSSSTQQNLNQNLEQKNSEINRLKGLIAEVNTTLDRHTQLMGTLAGELRQEVGAILKIQYFIEPGLEEVRLILLDDLIFKPKSVTKVNDLALTILEKVSEVISHYPTMHLNVISHTDNAPPARKSSVDNWNVSAQQAATVVRILTEEYDLSPSQVTLGAQGEFKPRASNETTSGKDENRRVEFIIAPRSEDLVRAIRSVIE